MAYQVRIWERGYFADLPYDATFTFGTQPEAEAAYDHQVGRGNVQAVELVERPHIALTPEGFEERCPLYNNPAPEVRHIKTWTTR